MYYKVFSFYSIFFRIKNIKPFKPLNIRQDYKEIFDRWSNCYYENSADTIEKIGNILEDIEYFVLNKDEELKEYYLEN